MKLRRVLLPVALTLSLLPGWVKATTFQVRGADRRIRGRPFSGSVGITEDATREPEIIVAGSAAPADLAALSEDHILILEGTSAAAERLGITANS